MGEIQIKMKIGIVQSRVGQVGGNDSILQEMLSILKHHDITIFTFEKPEQGYDTKIVHKTPRKLPCFGLYQKFFMPKHNLDDMDFVISNSYMLNTNKPCMIYDQNNMSFEFTTKLSEKYSRGFWKIYILPYKFLSRFLKINETAKYFSVSKYSADLLSESINKKVNVLYPSFNESGLYSKQKIRQICVMGRISPEKNLEQAVQICNELGVLSVIAGNVTESNMPYLIKLRKMANSNILFNLNPTRSEFLKFFAESKIYLSASKETLGLTTLEAIHSDCIPVVPNNSAHPEVVNDTLRYDSVSDAVSLITHLLDLKDNSKTIEVLKESTKKFSQNSFKERLLEVVS